ncbi:MAG: CHAT domain-containing protein [Symploca sp. SIO2D2]|nr:CHAT domain-containing protein [Symploca sp. SIO2D2]
MKTILILAANPKDTSRLRLDEEVREIDGVLRQAGIKDEFELKQRWAVRPRDVQQAMLSCNPAIVHFSGHGTGEQGLALEDGEGNIKLVDTAALAGLFKLFASQVECVILNACYSEVQAEAIAQYISYVIGMSQPIEDKAAIEFTVGFYNALGAGRSYPDAFEFGCNRIQLAGIAGYQTPVLQHNPNVVVPDASVESKTSLVKEEQLAELREEYDAVNEEVKALKKSLRIDDLTPKQRIKLKKQIQEAETERENLEFRRSNLE